MTDVPEKQAALADALNTLDRDLQALGLERSVSFGGFKWTGTFEGRDVTVRITRESRTRYAGEIRYRKQLGWRLRVEVHSAVPTSLYLVPAKVGDSRLLRRIYRWQGKSVTDALPGGLEAFRGVARDAAWAHSFLSCTALFEDLAGLLKERTTNKQGSSVYFEPERLFYGSSILQPADLDGQWVISRLRRMTHIAATADTLPPPARKDKPPRFAAFARERPTAAALLLMGGLLGAFLLLGLVFVAVLISMAVALN